jgi:hypothetical protein
MTDLVERLVPDELWMLFRRVVPPTDVLCPASGQLRLRMENDQSGNPRGGGTVLPLHAGLKDSVQQRTPLLTKAV